MTKQRDHKANPEFVQQTVSEMLLIVAKSNLTRELHFADGSSKSFAEIVKWFIKSFPKRHRELADELEVSQSTVSRWANHIAFPHSRMCQKIVASIRQRVESQNVLKHCKCPQDCLLHEKEE